MGFVILAYLLGFFVTGGVAVWMIRTDPTGQRLNTLEVVIFAGLAVLWPATWVYWGIRTLLGQVGWE